MAKTKGTAQGGTEKLNPDWAVTEGPDNSGGEIGVGIGRDDESEVHETTNDDTSSFDHQCWELLRSLVTCNP